MTGSSAKTDQSPAFRRLFLFIPRQRARRFFQFSNSAENVVQGVFHSISSPLEGLKLICWFNGTILHTNSTPCAAHHPPTITDARPASSISKGPRGFHTSRVAMSTPSPGHRSFPHWSGSVKSSHFIHLQGFHSINIIYIFRNHSFLLIPSDHPLFLFLRPCPAPWPPPWPWPWP